MSFTFIAVVEKPDGWYVERNKELVAGPYKTDAEAWKWLDAKGDDVDAAHDRVKTAFYDR